MENLSIDNCGDDSNDEDDSLAYSNSPEGLLFGNPGGVLDTPVESKESVRLGDEDSEVEGEDNVVKTEVNDGTEKV